MEASVKSEHFLQDLLMGGRSLTQREGIMDYVKLTLEPVFVSLGH